MNESDVFEPRQAAVGTNLKHMEQPQDESYKLTFFMENDPKYMQQKNNAHKFMIQSIEPEETHCVLTTFLYFIAAATLTYLILLWLKQKTYTYVEMLHWW